jgi:RNA polymerase sigma-70 factor (ECF subfamily)
VISGDDKDEIRSKDPANLENGVQTLPDGGILAQVARGADGAMERCIDFHGGLVWSIARRHVKDPSLVEDVVQEIFMDLWKSAGRYDPERAAETTFIGTLARRRAIDAARRHSRQPVTEPLPDFDTFDHAAPESDPALRCAREDVKVALSGLPEQTRELFALHFDEGLTHPEISEKTGLPLGTVKTQLRRGLIELRNTLRRLEGGEPPTSSPR